MAFILISNQSHSSQPDNAGMEKETNGRNPSIIIGAKANNLLEIAAALAIKPDVINDTDHERGLTSLHFAAVHGDVEAVQLLLNQPNARIDIKDVFGRDALDMAILSGREEVINMMFRYRAVQLGLAGDAEDEPQNGKSGDVVPFKPLKPSP